MNGFDDVLVVTVRKSFWASPEAMRWPRRIEERVRFGHSTNLVDSLIVFARALIAIALRPPRLVLLGSVERTVPWFIRARRYGLLRGAKLVVTNQLLLSPEQLGDVDAVIVYASAQAGVLEGKGVYVPLPADGDLDAARAEAIETGAVFTGGGTDRDFASVIDAVRDTDLQLEIVTFSAETLGYTEPLPANVRVHWRMPQREFLARMAGAAAVVVPLRSAESAHGQTTVVQALALGKPVVATRAVGTVDYLADDELLVDAGDVAGYRDALQRALDPRRSSGSPPDLGFAAYAERLRDVCGQVVRG